MSEPVDINRVLMDGYDVHGVDTENDRAWIEGLMANGDLAA